MKWDHLEFRILFAVDKSRKIYISYLVKELEKSNYEVATPVLKCDQGTLNKLISDKKAGRIGATTVVFNKNKKALYFSKLCPIFVGSCEWEMGERYQKTFQSCT